jgi:hypothetical protein
MEEGDYKLHKGFTKGGLYDSSKKNVAKNLIK